MPAQPLDVFLAPIAEWFRATFGAPSEAQALGWPPIARGESTLLLAPTGSGKTLAAFLVAIDRILRAGSSGVEGRTRIVYVSPLKALAVDVERNLRVPLSGIARHAARSGVELYSPTIAVRTGDTPAKERARMRRAPADILITTPESLYLILTSAAREALDSVDTLIVDEIHALVPTKRGAHLMLSIERLSALRRAGAAPLQRIGLSATQRPLDEAARLLGGFDGDRPRHVTIVDVGARKLLDLAVEAAALGPGAAPARVAARGEPKRAPAGPWPAIHARIVELVQSHRATIVFVNSRRLAERLASAINDLAGSQIALAHHGSLAPERREDIESRLKRGDLPAIVATSSLELGIDMGALDLVVQVEAPPSVTAGLQRIGRASHGLGGVPRGVLLPKHRQDLVACAAASAAMRAGEVEATSYPRNPLDVLAQQIVAMTAMDELSVDRVFELVRRAASFAKLPRTAFDGVLDMLSGRYPSDDFAELRPRITWDRHLGVITPRAGAHRLAVTSGGTIPDRGLYGVFTATGDRDSTEAGASRRVGELDEEMVFELRPGEVFLLGASSWRAEMITADRVVATPAPGEPGKMPFWHGDRPGRARAFGMRIGELVRRVATGGVVAADLRSTYALDAGAAEALLGYVRHQVEVAGEVPSDRVVVIERFLDDVGDWRIVVLCPLGIRVLAPWALSVAARLRETFVEVDVHYTDDGFALRIPACERQPPVEWLVPSPDEIETLVTRTLRGTALFAARFRECAARALLLPRRDPRRRTPLWAQRKRATQLLAVALRHPTFPMVLETYRECLQDAFDLPGLVELLRDIAERRVRVTTMDARGPSPFAASVLFAFVENFIYDGDAPPAERRVQALTIDTDRLRELLGEVEVRSLLDPQVIEDHERWLQRLSQPATSADGVHDMLLAIGDLSRPEIDARASPPDSAEGWVHHLVVARRIVAVPIAGEDRFIAAEDAAKFRDGIGVALPDGIAASLLAPAENATRDIMARFARTHGPFAASEAAHRFGLDLPAPPSGATAAHAALDGAIRALVQEQRLVRGSFLPRGTQEELCDRDVLDAIRRKSLARLRRAVEPVDVRALARFLPAWQGLTNKRRGRDALLAVIGELEGCPLIASALETEVLPSRLAAYQPWDLDALAASGEVVWAGIDSIGASDGRIALYLAEHEALLARPSVPVEGPIADALRQTLRRGAVFFPDLARAVGGFPGEVLDVLWDMVWAGEVTNDTLEPLRRRALSSSARPSRRGRPPRRPPDPKGHPRGGEGRWSLRASRGSPVPSDVEQRTAVARGLLHRYGIVTREVARAEGIVGGFARVYPVLKELEDQGRVRRGHFVEGRGGAQFASPGADERLRAGRETDAGSTPLVLAASDPANAWGALLDWPATRAELRPQRAAGALVVQRDGALIGWLGRRDRSLLTFLPEEPGLRSEAASALAFALGRRVDGLRMRAMLVSKIDGIDAVTSEHARVFVQAGFTATGGGLLKRTSPRENP